MPYFWSCIDANIKELEEELAQDFDDLVIRCVGYLINLLTEAHCFDAVANGMENSENVWVTKHRQLMQVTASLSMAEKRM
jgi:hypothetical protein